MHDEHSYRRAVYERYGSVSGLSEPLASKYESLKSNLSPWLAPLRNHGRLLDVGCGQGELLRLCREQGVQAEGIDGAPEVVASCRERGLDVTQVDDLNRFFRESEKNWDAITLIDVIEHFTKSEAFEILQLARRRLSTTGKVIVQTPNMQSPFAALNLYHDLTHEWGYTEASLTQLLRSAGYAKVEIRPARYPPTGSYRLRGLVRGLLYLLIRAALLVDQPNRGRILTPNLIAAAEI